MKWLVHFLTNNLHYFGVFCSSFTSITHSTAVHRLGNPEAQTMAKVISQETYDEVIKENIVEFSMSVVEAREETIQQFEAQGINLANIIKDLTINETTGQPVLNESIESLKKHINGENILSLSDLEKQLDVLVAELCKSTPHRVHAGKVGTQECLLKIIEAEITNGTEDGHLENSVSY